MTSIRSRLTGGEPRSLHGVAEVVELVLTEPARLAELIDSILDAADDIVRMRAGDALEKVCRMRPDLLEPHVSLVLGTLSAIDQNSVQWHAAQILGEVRLDAGERARAARVVRRYLDDSTDWIVLNCSLETLAVLARKDGSLVPPLLDYLHRFEQSQYRSLASRSRKLLAEFA